MKKSTHLFVVSLSILVFFVLSINANAADSKKKWDGNISLGGSLQSGNTDRTSVSATAEAVKKSEDDRFSLRFSYNYAEEDSNLSSRNTYGALKYDYYLSPQFYTYLSVEVLADEFKDLNFQTTIGPGVGYQVWDDEKKKLDLEAGVSYSSKNYDLGVDEQWAAARLAASLGYNMTQTLIFSDYLTVFPALESGAGLTLRNEAAISTALGAGWALKIANIIEHDNEPTVGVEKTDSTTSVGLQYLF